MLRFSTKQYLMQRHCESMNYLKKVNASLYSMTVYVIFSENYENIVYTLSLRAITSGQMNSI